MLKQLSVVNSDALINRGQRELDESLRRLRNLCLFILARRRFNVLAQHREKSDHGVETDWATASVARGDAVAGQQLPSHRGCLIVVNNREIDNLDTLLARGNKRRPIVADMAMVMARVGGKDQEYVVPEFKPTTTKPTSPPVKQPQMTRRVVDYENLLDHSFSDANVPSLKTTVRSRWERKKLQQQEQKQHQHRVVLGSATNLSASNGSASSSSSSLAAAVTSAPTENSNSTTAGGDRFIPHRANLDLGRHLLRTASSDDENADSCVPDDVKAVADDKKNTYASHLTSAFWGGNEGVSTTATTTDDGGGGPKNRIMSYQDKAPVPTGDAIQNLNVLYSSSAPATKGKRAQRQLVSRHIPTAPSRVLDAPDLMDDYYLNLVSWSDTNVLAVALGPTVYLWDAGTGEIQELCTYEDDSAGVVAHISSVQWVQQGGAHLAVGTSGGTTQLWDVEQVKLLRKMDGHTDRVGSLAWNRHILTTGSRDATIIQHDVRVARHQQAVLSGHHQQEVCGLAWSPDGETLASGGNDNLLFLWDATATSRPRFRFTDHQAAVKALAWSPHERSLLATGGGTADRTIKFWNGQTGALLNSVDAGSQVCALQWNPYEKELLSSHGFARNQLTLWKYPSLTKIQEFEGHSARVLHMAVSPCGGTVLSAAADETLRFWDVFGGSSTKQKSVPQSSKLSGPQRIGRGRSTRWTSHIR